MHRNIVTGIAVLLAPLAASAQTSTTPPIKPGLWEAVSQREVDGQKASDPTDAMKKMPPEARKQFEATMRQKGMDVGAGGGAVKICLSRETLDQGTWQGRSGGCTTDFTSRTAASWKWRSQCTQPPSTGEGEALFTSPEAYTVKSTMTSTIQGKAQTTRMIVNAKWLGADCGSLPPMKPQ
jgi:hypothetical protein